MKDFEDIYPLCPVQEGMLFHDLYAGGGGEYVLQLHCKIRQLRVREFRRAWESVVQRHAILRTSFVWEGVKRPVQVVHRKVELEWREKDWRSLSIEEQNRNLDEFRAQDMARGFVLSSAPLTRIALIQLADGEHEFIWTKHHALLDGWSGALVVEEVGKFYQAYVEGIEPRMESVRPYRDYIAWLYQQDLREAERYWRNVLAGFRAPTSLPVESHERAHRYGECALRIGQPQLQSLQHACRSMRITVNTLAQCAWALVLSRYSGNDDVMFGATTSGRPTELAGAERMVGLFINTLPVRLRVKQGIRVEDWLHKSQQRHAEWHQYEHTPLQSVQRWSELPPGTAMFDSIVVFENYPIDTTLRTGGALQIEEVGTVEATNYGLTLMVRAAEELVLVLLYDERQYKRVQVDRLLDHYRNLLFGMCENPHALLELVEMLSASERHQLTVRWNQTEEDFGKGSLLDLLQRGLEVDAIAVDCEGEQISYGELHRRAGLLARWLQQLGVGPEIPVAVCLKRSPELVIALLAVLKAGGAYVPLDPGYPQQRLTYMLQDSAAPVLLTHSQIAQVLPSIAAQTIWVDAFPFDSGGDALPSAPKTNGQNLAYIIYTSGSTGMPKGAMNTHAGVCNRLLWMKLACGVDASDRVLQKTPVSFDVSVWEIFLPLIAGSRLILARPDGHKDPDYLISLIQRESITLLHFVPSMFQAFLDAPNVERCLSLRGVVCSGEALSGELRTRFFARLPRVLHNFYGPTEAAVDVTSFLCQSTDTHESVPIGRPISNVWMRVLDSRQRLVPALVPGEIYIGGAGLGRGYWRKPDLTAEKFVPDPYATQPGQRLYRTGDLGNYLLDGNLQFLERIDAQVKIRGMRIELGEIEMVLLQHPSVSKAVVLASGSTANSQLVGFVVFHPGSDVNPSVLQGFLGEHLPEFMVPARMVSVENFPLLPNGKLDRKALALALPGPCAPKGMVAPATETERTIAAVWQEILGISQVGSHDRFFDLGGNSLLAIRAHQKLRDVLNRELTLVDTFRFPTVASLAAHLTSGANGAKELASEELTRVAERGAARRAGVAGRFSAENASAHEAVHGND